MDLYLFFILGVFPLVIADVVYAVNVYYSGKIILNHLILALPFFHPNHLSGLSEWSRTNGTSYLFIGKDYIPDIDCEKIGTFLVYLWIIAEFRV